MKILHLDTGREMRGGQRQVLLLMEALARRGHQQLLLAPKSSPLFAETRSRGLDAERLGWRMPSGFDLLHAHDAQGHTRAALWGGRVPLVVARRVAFPIHSGPLSRWKYRRASHFVAVSEYARRQLLRAGVPEQRISVVYDGTRLPDPARAAELRAAFRRERQLAPDAFVAGTIAPPPEKPLHLFRAAVAARPRIHSLVAAPDDPSPFLFALDVFVYLSESEGLGSAIVLAMAHGLAVIASDVGGIPEIVRHRQTGLLVRNDAREVGLALEELLADEPLRRALGCAARDWVAGSATDDIMAGKSEAVYRQVLES